MHLTLNFKRSNYGGGYHFTEKTQNRYPFLKWFGVEYICEHSVKFFFGRDYRPKSFTLIFSDRLKEGATFLWDGEAIWRGRFDDCDDRFAEGTSYITTSSAQDRAFSHLRWSLFSVRIKNVVD